MSGNRIFAFGKRRHFAKARIRIARSSYTAELPDASQSKRFKYRKVQSTSSVGHVSQGIRTLIPILGRIGKRAYAESVHDE
jgi:hypothetical protein